MGTALVIRSTSCPDPTGGQGMQITTEQAERISKASILKARELGIAVCIAVLDAGGHLKIFHRR
jgi:uncharacterized protein GlcG (DUF336 family)